jgi:16S rRNA (guanine1516-N2)-methyltransferase
VERASKKNTASCAERPDGRVDEPPVVLAARPQDEPEARRIAEHLGSRVELGAEPDRQNGAVALRLDGEGLALVGDGLTVRADLARMLPRLAPGKLGQELLVRAAKIKGASRQDGPLTAVDATAGLGDDALLLAAAGFAVELFERDPVIAALLRDGLRRAAHEPRLAELVGRMHLHEADSVAGLAQLEGRPDVVLLDPMFPARTKSALVKKKFQLLHHLEEPCTDEEALVQAALGAGPRKVVIKRTAKGPYLGGVKPAYSIAGKAVRYDCLVVAR